MRLFLLRHAEAGSAYSDSARPLTGRGIRQVEQLANKFLPRFFSGIKSVEHSTLLRAKQTAEIFQNRLNLAVPLEICEYITPEYDDAAAAKMIAGSDADRLLVGHNMLYYKLAGRLLGGGENFVEVEFGNACLLALNQYKKTSARLPFGEWHLSRFVGPDDET